MFALLAAYSFRQYMNAYSRYANNFWDNMTPMQYGCLLIFIAICGYILMRSSR
ncbi:hypothetical protein [Planctomicrobium piriforme]|uniref:Uncharacterized protein n=1 Tax=Planctomicrobium piriforme TaxID=1576369 RepID=A0A1I3CZ05_9PLAN|nr:hypothetical protein [Planctomicrobium piriforme]SFH79780.1 hypothetical protein SAMN05421753_10325 [Planctomicrobium piriforme]